MSRAQNQSYRIVCGVDFNRASGEAVREALRLSKRVSSSELHFVHALDGPAGTVDSVESQRNAEWSIAKLEDYVQSVLFDLNVSISELRAVFHVRLDDPQSALVSVAREEHADVIIIGASARGFLAQLWRRAGVRSFMRRAPVPVLVAHERKQDPDAGVSEPRNGGSGLYSVGRRSPMSAASARSMEGDSTSSLYRMYEARSSQADLPKGEPRRLVSGR